MSTQQLSEKRQWNKWVGGERRQWIFHVIDRQKCAGERLSASVATRLQPLNEESNWLLS